MKEKQRNWITTKKGELSSKSLKIIFLASVFLFNLVLTLSSKLNYVSKIYYYVSNIVNSVKINKNSIIKSIAVILVALALIPNVFAVSVSHPASSIYNGTFQAGNYLFQDNVTINANLTVDTNTLFVDSSNNRVGIGTTGPGAKLSVDVDGTHKLHIRSTIDLANSVALWTTNEAESTNYPMEFRADGYLFTDPVGTTGFGFIGGNVGINTTHPEALLHVNGSVAGVNAIFENGKVGIGTTSPGVKLDVYDGTGTQAIFSGWADIRGTDEAVSGQITIGATAAYRGNIQYNGNAGDLYIDNTYDNNDGDIRFRTKTAGTAVNAITILGGGNVGIGATNPAYKLTVEGGSINVTGTDNLISLGWGNITGNKALTNGTDVYFTGINISTGGLNSSIGGSTFFIDASKNRTGIGTKTPATLFHINYSMDTQGHNHTGVEGLLIQNSAPSIASLISFRAANSASQTMTIAKIGAISTGGASVHNGDMVFSVRSGNRMYERMRIVDTGKLGINTTKPKETLHVNGTFSVTYDSTQGLYQDVNGNVGIGTTNPGKELEVAGRINGTELNISGNANFGYSTGKIGINNTNPSSNLQLQGTFNATDGSGAMMMLDGTGNVIIKLGT